MTDISWIGTISMIQTKSKLATSDTNDLTVTLTKGMNDKQKPRQTISPPAVSQQDCKMSLLETNLGYL